MGQFVQRHRLFRLVLFATRRLSALTEHSYERKSYRHFLPEFPLNAPSKPAPSPYAALNGGRDDAAQAPGTTADADTARLAAESDRLAALKRALWESFQIAPQSPVRAPIVDVTMAYTDALRLELRLRAAGKKPSTAPRVQPKSGFRTD